LGWDHIHPLGRETFWPLGVVPFRGRAAEGYIGHTNFLYGKSWSVPDKKHKGLEKKTKDYFSSESDSIYYSETSSTAMEMHERERIMLPLINYR
jgi:hypothetical protein